MRVETEYISVGANRSASCSGCSSEGLLAFGAGKTVALWDTEAKDGRGTFATLRGHTGEVTKVKVFEDRDSQTTIFSGDTNGEIRRWSRTNSQEFRCTLHLTAHENSAIAALALLPDKESSPSVVITSGGDALVHLWDIYGTEPRIFQTLDLKGKLALDVVTAYLPGTQVPILAVSCTDRRIRLYVSIMARYELVATLEGHEDWVKSLALTTYPSSTEGELDLLLASGSADNYVRLWRISKGHDQVNGHEDLDMLDDFERRLGDGISTKAHTFTVKKGPQYDSFGRPYAHVSASTYNVTLDALLVGHEGGITDLNWSRGPTPHLLSTSLDNSMIIWQPSSQGIWVTAQRFGSIGSRALGMFGAVWGKDRQSVFASGWNGGWERWVEADQGWGVRAGATGHSDAVKGVCWDPKGEYLLSVGADQTTRIHGPIPSEAGPSTWAEIARPQVHGYDMTDAAFINPLRYVSTADEKLARVFDAPRGFAESLQSLGISSDFGDLSERPQGATVPPLGLSNRAVGKEQELPDHPTPTVPHQSRDAISQAFQSKPTEEELATTTLWPEVEKVYGHGYELVAVATSHDGALVATACRASNAEHAVVRVNSTSTWDAVGEPLSGHSLTINRIAFSPDDSMILTCSRDRGWRLFRSQGSGFSPFAVEEKAHARMVLDACWSPTGQAFATGSRDKTVKLWRLAGDQVAPAATIKLSDGVTAVDWKENWLAVGIESGGIYVYDVSDLDKPHLLLCFDDTMAPVTTVCRLAWCPGKPLLASCSDDHSLRIHLLI